MEIKKISKEQLGWFDLQRKVVSYMTSKSWKQIPHVTYVYEPDITDFYEEFKTLAEQRGKLNCKISFNTIMVKVIVEGLLSAPDLNSFVDYNYKKAEGKMYICDEINVSIPWLLSDGKMITPILFNAQKKSLDEISASISDLTQRIEKTNVNEMLYQAVVTDTVDELKKMNLSGIRRILAAKISGHRVKGLKGKEKNTYYKIPENKRLTHKDIVNGTVTISNIGSLYKEQRGFFALLEIIPPQIFAVGIGSVQEKPGIYLDENGTKQIGIRKILPMCLAFDHRAVDFSSLVPFLKRADEIFAKPNIIYEW